MVFYGAGASNTTNCAADHGRRRRSGHVLMFDSHGALGRHREDIRPMRGSTENGDLRTDESDGRQTIEEGMKGADVLIALSTPGPDTVKPSWIRAMAPNRLYLPARIPYRRSIRTRRRNPARMLWPRAAAISEPGQQFAGFPGILKGALLVRAKKITDNMAIAALARWRRSPSGVGFRDVHYSHDGRAAVFPQEASDVAMQALQDGVARVSLFKEDVYKKPKRISLIPGS